MLVEIAGEWVEIEGIVTGLTKNPFDCEPVIPMPRRVNWLKAEGLAPCAEHEHYSGFEPPTVRCAKCWRNHLELKRRDWTNRHAATYRPPTPRPK
jgi:hypothetical protein